MDLFLGGDEGVVQTFLYVDLVKKFICKEDNSVLSTTNFVNLCFIKFII